MLTITVPHNFVPERKYCAEVLFREIIGVDFDLQFADTHQTEIVAGKHKLILADSFWKPVRDEDSFLVHRKPPKLIDELAIADTSHQLVAIYGQATHELYSEDGFECEFCGIDIFASSFFMLSRWEEFVSQQTDLHGRFPYTNALAYRHKFLHRPIVNEYCMYIRSFLQRAGVAVPELPVARFFYTSDIDFVFKWRTAFSWAKTVVGDVCKRRDLRLAFENSFNFLKAPFSKYTDPYNTYRRQLYDAKKTGAEIIFYILPSKENIRFLSTTCTWLFDRIEKFGGTVGLHPGYDSHLANGHLHKEKKVLEDLLGKKVHESRQHFLRFSVPETWSMLQKRGITCDSTMYYTEVPGFRTGCCTEYSCYDIVYRKKLSLKERTLIFMDTSVFFREWQEPEGANAYLAKLIEQVERYGGDFVMLWHNSSFDSAVWDAKLPIYNYIVSHFIKKAKA